MEGSRTYPEQEIALFKQIAAGDEEAFKAIFHQYNSALFPFILSIVKTEADAREVIQEVFLKCWLQRDRLGDVANPGGWLRTVAANAAYDWLRGEARYQLRLRNLPGEEAVEDLVLELDARHTKALIDEAVEQLPARRREVFRLARVQGYTRREIAEQLGLSENTVRNQLAEAVNQVQDYLQRHSAIYIPAILILLQQA